MNKGRLETFSDGVFAIVVTLLVLELRLPQHLNDSQVLGALLHLWPRLSAFILTFGTIGVFWVAHHIMLQAASRVDRVLLWVNNAFLMCVSLLPFSAAVLGTYPHAHAAIVLYGLNMVAIEIFLEWLWLGLTRGGHGLRPGVSPEVVGTGHRRVLSGLGIYALGALLSFVAPLWLSIALYWLSPLSYIVLQTVVDRRREKSAV